MKPLVYLAGPISGLNFDGATSWRDSVKEVLGEWGIKALSPLREQEHLKQVGIFTNAAEEAARLESPMSMPKGLTIRDRWDAMRCDVLLVNLLGAKTVSIGTMLEIAWANAKDIPIVCAMEEAPQHTIDHAHLGWLASLIDGEGCVYVVRRVRDSGNPCFEFRIQVTMTDKEMIDAAYERSNGLGVIQGPYKRNNNPQWREAWRWTVNNKDAATLAAAIFPYLVIKRAQAALGYEIERINATFRPEGHKGHKGFQRRTPEIIREQEDLYAKWKAAKDREVVEFAPPPAYGNPHEHAMVNQLVGFRVPTLWDACDVTRQLLAA
ncbi:nucleoside 2-deoxyribosyltransferase [Bradyrhizobium elkanii]